MSEPVLIVGGGPAGMALALALHRCGVASRIVDARPRGAAQSDARIPSLLHARGAGLLALDLFPPVRSFLARRMMFGARGW